MKNINKIISKFKLKNILIIGDIILDRYIKGDINRISPESPIPVMSLKNKEIRLGGAANVANNIVSMGADCTLIGQVGIDSYLDKLNGLLQKNNIKKYLIENDNYKTIVKTRIISGNQQIIRIDDEIIRNISTDNVNRIIAYVQNNSFDLIIISDYGKGMITKKLIADLKLIHSRIIVDPKPQNIHLFKDVFALCPNYEEAKQYTKMNDIHSSGKKLMSALNSNIVITNGKEGASLFELNDGNSFSCPSEAKEVFDVSGAGDTFISAFSLAIASDADLIDSVIMGNVAAGIVVSKRGTSIVSDIELLNAFENKKNKLISPEALEFKMNEYKKQNKKIIFTNGCFDILHAGHIKLLNKAKQLGDVLVLALNSDISVKKNKGQNRPINNEADRVLVLSNLIDIDYIILFDDETPLELIKIICPDIIVKGADYKKTEVIGYDFIKKYFGKVELIEIYNNKSTTGIIERL